MKTKLNKLSKADIEIGLHFGEWEVIGEVNKTTHKVAVRCSCGKCKDVNVYTLLNGRSTSCGHNMNRDKVVDLTGRQFGELKVQKYLGNQIWECLCSCGRIVNKHRTKLLDGRAKSCGHGTSKEPLDIKGKQFGKLKVLEYAGNKNWLVECECGTRKLVRGANLRNGSTVSCGCLSYKATKDELIHSIKEFTTKNNKKPTVWELAEFIGISENQMRYALIKNELYNSSNIYKRFSSKYESEIFEYLLELGIRADEIHHNVFNIIPSMELDIYIPSLKLAIEFNGGYWHSELHKDKHYHQNKTLECFKRNIRLIHIFEHEYISNKDKIKDIIKFAVGKYEVVYGRNTQVREISNKTANEFISKYHLQGKSQATINIGCYYGDELIGVMTFGKPRFNSNYSTELIRLCWLPKYKVLGGANKMFKYYINKYNPESIISYCNISKFTGKVYTELGFRLSNNFITEPNYVWFDCNSKEYKTRYQTMKSKLVDKGLCDKLETEDAAMYRLGYIKVYDSGNFKYEWIAESE